MADRPIIFSAPMIRALLDGRKTQTRRIVPQNVVDAYYEYDDWCRNVSAGVPCSRQWEVEFFLERCRYAPGDRLWVREAWHAARSHDGTPPRDIPRDASIEHAATARSYSEIGLKGKLRPGMFMPRWASRLTLIVESVKVERLQDISEADAIAEGVERKGWGFTWPNAHDNAPPATARTAFSMLWESINGAGSWDANPWIVAVTFRVIRANIDSEEVHNG